MTEPKKCSIDEFEAIVKQSENNYSTHLRDIYSKALLVLTIFIIYMIIPKTVWLSPTKTVNELPNPYTAPELNINQKLLDSANSRGYYSKDKFIEYKSLKNRKTYYLLPLAEYSITARIKEKNTFFFLQSDFDKVALVDYGLAYEDMAKDEYFHKIYSTSDQTFYDRRLVYGFKHKYFKEDYQKYYELSQYLFDHVSHTHVIPANKKVYKALKAARKGQVIKLDGYLVDIYDRNYYRFAMTSLSLTDRNESSRGYGKGGGSCEVMYVKSVQIGNKVFE